MQAMPKYALIRICQFDGCIFLFCFKNFKNLNFLNTKTNKKFLLGVYCKITYQLTVYWQQRVKCCGIINKNLNL